MYVRNKAQVLPSMSYTAPEETFLLHGCGLPYEQARWFLSDMQGTANTYGRVLTITATGDMQLALFTPPNQHANVILQKEFMQRLCDVKLYDDVLLMITACARDGHDWINLQHNNAGSEYYAVHARLMSAEANAKRIDDDAKRAARIDAAMMIELGAQIERYIEVRAMDARQTA